MKARLCFVNQDFQASFSVVIPQHFYVINKNQIIILLKNLQTQHYIHLHKWEITSVMDDSMEVEINTLLRYFHVKGFLLLL